MPNLAQRILTAAVLLPAVGLLVLFGPAWSLALVLALFAALAGFELAAMACPRRPLAAKLAVALSSALTAGAVALSFAAPAAPLVALLAIAPLSLLVFMALSGSAEPPISTANAAVAAFGATYCGALIGSISLLHPIPALAWPLPDPADAGGRIWILLLILGIVASDTFAYAFGRLFGVRKLAPRISPGKTWAGAVGGVVGTVVAVAAFKLLALPGLRWWEIAALGVPLSILGQLGDLAESLLKRGFGVKDSGRLIPGHGGVLDRLDALMFGAPFVLLYSLVR
jgi:phosphatidate cytidylyltransferase